MINPVCPLSDKEKLKTTLHHNCEYSFKNHVCNGCPYMGWTFLFPNLVSDYMMKTQPMPQLSYLPFNLKYRYNGEEK